jgi:predicted RNA binding protein YcfA (HicA-like mRNA interferase family)
MRARRTGVRGRTAELVDELRGRGWRLDRITGSGHLKMTHPNGGSIIISRSPGDGRGLSNLRSTIKRIERGTA